MPPHERAMIYENLAGIEAKIEFMVNTDSRTRVAILRYVSDREVTMLVAHMPPDEAVEVLEDISERRFRRVMELLEPGKALKIREIKKHRRNTAGRLMTNEFFGFTLDITIGQASSYIRMHPGIDLTQQIFVLNEAGQLQGYVPAQLDRQFFSSSSQAGDEASPASGDA